jgi:hypothetical protein
MHIDVRTAYHLTALIIGVGALVSTLELLASHRAYLPQGMFSWNLVRRRRMVSSRRWLQRGLAPLFDLPGVLFLLGLRLAAAGGIVVGVVAFGTLPAVPVLLLLATTLLVNLRHPYGMDGADQMSSIVVVVLALHVATPKNQFVAQEGLWFLALQLSLSYFTAGVAKVFSPKWRSGTAVIEVLSTVSYGRADLKRLLQAVPVLSQALNYGVVVFECVFPVVLILGGPTTPVFLVGGVLLHAAIAMSMGLNTFFWAFVATYPSVAFCARHWA